MRTMLFVLSVVAATAGIGTCAEAQNYPWCSIYTGSMGGSQNCGFSTYQQCMENVSRDRRNSVSSTTPISRPAPRRRDIRRIRIPDRLGSGLIALDLSRR